MLELVVNCGRVVTTASGMDATLPGNDGLCFLNGDDSVATRDVAARDVAALATDMGSNIRSGACCLFLLDPVTTTLLCFRFMYCRGSKFVISAATALSVVVCDAWVALASGVALSMTWCSAEIGRAHV